MAVTSAFDVDSNATRALSATASKLSPHEQAWKNKQRLLQDKGYMLRPRLRPGWVPSWIAARKYPPSCEDFHRLPYRPSLVDATRISDGRLVYVKRVPTKGSELEIALLLYGDNLRNDPANHSVPILDSFQDDEDPTKSYIVMPFLRLMDDPMMEYVNDVVEFVDQMLEGLLFMHNQGIAHRDCTRKNLMMDASAMYPKGFHPVQAQSLPDAQRPAQTISRLGIWPPTRYFFVDFGISVQIPPGVQPKRALGDLGIDREVPELSTSVPYDPFKVDVFIMGNVFRRHIIAKFNNVNFLHPLAESMTAHDPQERPDAKDALERWHKIRAGVCFLRRGALLTKVDAPSGIPIIFDIVAFLKLGVLLSRRILSWVMSRRRERLRI